MSSALGPSLSECTLHVQYQYVLAHDLSKLLAGDHILLSRVSDLTHIFDVFKSLIRFPSIYSFYIRRIYMGAKPDGLCSAKNTLLIGNNSSQHPVSSGGRSRGTQPIERCRYLISCS